MLKGTVLGDFSVDDVKTKYYTGLPPYELLQVVFSIVTIGLLLLLKMGYAVFFSSSLWY